ncbi:Amino acid adenylation [Marinomonas sp. MED121]|uniref:non-ribosomal peptide synthetase n=1 Tax=Marinomonas sp. MED121 TaxID=314277 RepID=UPI0000691293|nr:non-ribosomal peptide synthetase [Marinomonas sp. MED121]EAQ64104.1 Amino acid adenylation [Marinomonas sp. MED121]
MPQSLIQKAKALGVFLYLENGALKYRSSKGKLPAELAQELKQDKTEIMAFLSQYQGRKAEQITPVPQSIAPLTFTQNRVFYLEKMTQGDTLYHMTAAFDVKRKLDPDLLEAAIIHLLNRHNILTTCFLMNEEGAYQKVVNLDESPFRLEHEVKRVHDKDAWLCEKANQGFDLSHSPLMRVHYLDASKQPNDTCLEDESCILFVFHHLIFDGYSYTCFFNELNHIYQAKLANEPIKLAQLDFQYGDYAHWQASHKSYVSQETMDFWRAKMTRVRDLNTLPTDFIRTANALSEGSLIEDKLSLKQTAKIKAFAQSQGVSLFTLLCSVYSILISRWTNDPDVLIGTPVSGRDQDGLENLIGFFANTLLIRSDVVLDKNFHQVLEESKQNLADSFRHQNMPFEKIVEQAGHTRSQLNAPILQILFVLNQADKTSLELEGCNIQKRLVNRNKINFELELHVTDQGQTLDLHWVYAHKLFHQDSINGFKDSFLTLLDAIIASPDKPIKQLPLVSQKGKAQIDLWNKTDKLFPQQGRFIDRFEARVSNQGDKIACTWHCQNAGVMSLTYQELNEKANQVAHYLLTQKVTPNTCVAMGYSWSINGIISILGILKSGAAYVPLDTQQPKQRLMQILDAADIKLLLGPQSLIDALNEKQSLSDVTCLDLNRAHKILAPFSVSNPILTELDDSQLAYVIFTSGSTGQPKGVMLEHKNLNNLLDSMQERVNYHEHDVVAAMTASFFDIHIAETLMSLSQGASISILNHEASRSANAIQKRVIKDKISIIQATPSVWQWLVDNDFRPNEGTKIITGGDHLSLPLRNALLKTSHQVTLFNLYAPSEATVYCSGGEVLASQSKIHIGKPFSNNRYYILDESLNHLPIGGIGELYIAGANIARGYLGNPRLTDAFFTPDPFSDQPYERMYQTGDLAKRLEDGSVELVGRKDFQLKLNGIRIEASDIEFHLCQIEGIDKALVTSKDVAQTKCLVAYLILKDGFKLNLDQVRDNLSLSVAHSVMPQYFIELDAFPLTNNLKIDRNALPTPAEQTKTHAMLTDKRLANTPTQRWLASLWETLLAQKNIDIHSNFFSLGGHSLLAIKLTSQISHKLGQEFSLKRLLQAGNIYNIARLMDDEKQLEDTLALDKTPNSSIENKANIKQTGLTQGELSYSQLRLWSLDTLQTKGLHYSVPLKFALKGELNIDALEQSLDAIRDKHHILRTAYVVCDEQAKQRVLANTELPKVLSYLNCRSSEKRDTLSKSYQDNARLARREQKEQKKKLTKLEKIKELAHFEKTLLEAPFNLDKGEVFRAGLAKLTHDEFQLFIGIHHIAIDGVSCDILIKEINQFYQHFDQQKNEAWLQHDHLNQVLPIQYIDYALWQKQYFHSDLEQKNLEKESQQNLVAYWRNRLTGIKSKHSAQDYLPLDYTRPDNSSYRGKDLSTEIDTEYLNKLFNLAKTLEVTPFSVIYSAFVLLLSRYSGDKDIVIGTPSANRSQPDVEKLIGFFVNNLALRSELADKVSFNELILQSHQNLMSDFDHESLPFEQVIQTLNPKRSLKRHPIFQMMLVLEQAKTSTLSLGNSDMIQLRPNHTEARFDITLGAKLDKNALRFNWNYSLDLFKDETIKEVANNFNQLLTACLDNPSQNAFSLPMVPEVERSEVERSEVKCSEEGITHKTNSIEQAHLESSSTLVNLFSKQVERHPNAIALCFKGQNLSYQALDHQSNQFAHYLISKGAKKGSIIAIALNRSNNMLLAMLAVLKAGAAYLPIDIKTPAKRVKYMLEGSQASFLMTDQSWQFNTLNYQEIRLNDVHSAEFEKQSSKPVILAEPSHSHDLAYLIYTSGSTGNPKGVLIEHKGVVNYVKAQSEYLELNHQDIDKDAGFLYLSNFAFDTSVASIWGALLNARRVDIIAEEDRFDLDKINQYLTQPERFAVAYIPPILLANLTPDPKANIIPRIVISGEAVAQDLVDNYLEKTCLINEYGPTENSVCSSYHIYQKGDDANLIGQAIPGVMTLVLDEYLNPVPSGVIGQLYLAGVGLARGYLNQAELTNNVFIEPSEKHPFRLYKTGDLVKENRAGQLSFEGRIDDQVKLRGFRIELGEIEKTLETHPHVISAKVLVTQALNKQKQLTAYLIHTADYQALLTELSHQLSSKLPDYMVPQAWAALDAWPLTANGKLARAELPIAYPIAAGAQVQDRLPKTPLEKAMLDLYKSLLKQENLNLNDNFFALGGDSIIAMQLVAKASRQGLFFSVKDLFEYPSIAALMPHIKEQKRDEISQDATDGKQALLPIQHEFFHYSSADKLNRFNQCVFLTLPKDLDFTCLKHVIKALITRHDALRLKFSFNEKVLTYQESMAIDSLCDNVSLPSLDPSTLKSAADSYHDQFHLQQTPLMKAVRFYSQNDAVLFINIHHLIIDAVSWQILIEDLKHAFLSYKKTKASIDQTNAPVLGPKTQSYQTWSQWINAKPCLTYFIENEAEYWQKVVTTSNLNPSHFDHDVSCQINNGHRNNTQITLSKTLTQALLKTANKAYQTETLELLLTSVYLGISKLTQSHHLSFCIETHGRDGLTSFNNKLDKPVSLDISQTLGWFTSTFPFVVNLESKSIESILCHIKETFRHVPNNGLGFGVLSWLQDSPCDYEHKADILFNYFGQTDQAQSREESQDFNLIHIDTQDGAFQHMKPHPIAMNARISQDQLCIDLSYLTALFSDAQIKGVKASIESALNTVISHCVEQDKVKHTPSDFSLAKIKQDDIDRWQAQLLVSGFTIDNIYPATGMQEGLLYHSQLQADAYLTQLCLTYYALDLVSLKNAWRTLVQRHDIFRTAFMTSDEGDQYQLVSNKAELDWRYIDYTGQDKTILNQDADDKCIVSDSELECIETIKRQDKAAGFDLSKPCLMRFSLIKKSENQFNLIWTNHHALIDGWCLPLILAELKDIYTALVHSKPLLLNDAPSYVNYIQWLEHQDKSIATRYWHNTLSHLETPTKMPFYASQTSHNTSDKGAKTNQTIPNKIEENIRLNAADTKALKALAHQSQSTLNSIFQGAWGVLLANYTDTKQVVFGTTVSGRTPEVYDVENMIGLFINTLPVCISLDNNDAISTWLKRIRESHLEAEAHGYLALQDIQKASPIRQQNLFDSILVFENYPIGEAQTSNQDTELTLVSLESDEETNYPLTILVVEQGEIEIKLLSNEDYLEPWQAKQVLKHFKQLMLEMIHPENKLLADLSILDEKEVKHQLDGLNPTPCHYLDQSISECFAKEVARNPDKIALIYQDTKLTYQALNVKANQLAHYLIKQGIGKRCNVGIYSQRSIEMVTSMLAIIKTGACYVPLDANYPQARLQHMVDTANIGIILCDDTMTTSSPQLNARYITLTNLPPELSHENVDSFSALDFETSFPNLSMNDLTAKEKSQLPAYVMFTSGSTGLPKGAVVPHQAVIRLVKETNYVDLNQDKTMAQINNFSFDASTFEIWGALLNGATLVILPNEEVQNPSRFSQQIKTQGIDVVLMTTALMNQLAALNDKIFSPLDTLLFGGEKVDKKTIDSILRKGKPSHLLHIYGPTENATFSTCYEINGVSDNYPIGSAIKHSTTYILSSQRRLMPFGQVGELYVGGIGLAKGYLGQSELTKESFIQSPFDKKQILYATGDLVRYLADGSIEYMGRVDDQFKLRGYRIERLEILNQILCFEAIAQASVELISRENQAHLSVAMTLHSNLTTQADKDSVIGSLTTHLSSRLASFMMPKEFHIYDELPMTQNGKLDRKKIQSLLTLETGTKQVNTASPRDEIEMDLYKIWLGILLNKDISIKDNFFDIGGSSISAIKVIHQIEKKWAVSVSIADMLKAPTIEDLGGIVREAQEKGSPNEYSELIQFRKGEGKLNVICPHLGGGTAYGYLSLAKVLPDEYGVYGIQAKGVDTDDDFLPDVQAMASYYLSLIDPMLDTPHVFLGCSYGGYVAFEMARIVQEAGYQSCAILLDSDGTNDQTVLDQISPVSLAVFRQKLITYNGMYPNIDDAQIDRYFRVYNHHLMTLKTMQLANSQAKTILVLATGDKPEKYMASLTEYWSQKSDAEFVLEKVDGDHSTMLQAPTIEKVADIIKTQLANR